MTANDINKMLSDYIKTPQGKAYVKQSQADMFNNKSKTTGLLSETIMIEIADDLKDILYKHIVQLIPSFDQNGIVVSSPFSNTDGVYIIHVDFTDASLRRNSLRTNNGFTGSGVYDIVGLFVHGYTASHRVYGYWTGHEDTHVIGSKVSINPNDFIQCAVKEFNLKHVSDGVVVNYDYSWGGTL